MTTPFPYSPAIPYGVARRGTASRSTGLMYLVLAYVALMQVQITFDSSATGYRIAPADLCLLLSLVFVPGALKYRKPAWSIWHAALLLVFAMGTLVQAFNEGFLN